MYFVNTSIYYTYSFLISEPFLESVPQVHLIMLIIFEGTDTTVDPFHWKTLLTFSLSVLSAAFGMSRFFNVGPCRLVPYGKMNVGFLFLVISIATCLVGKGTVYIRTVHTAQWCIFNNYSLDKHRHQIWDHFLISVLKTEITNWPWILPQFTTSNRKMALVPFFGRISFKNNNFKNPCSFEKKKSLFIFERKYSKGTLLFQNCKSYIFTFLTLFDFKSFGGVPWPLSFFLMNTN